MMGYVVESASTIYVRAKGKVLYSLWLELKFEPYCHILTLLLEYQYISLEAADLLWSFF